MDNCKCYDVLNLNTNKDERVLGRDCPVHAGEAKAFYAEQDARVEKIHLERTKTRVARNWGDLSVTEIAAGNANVAEYIARLECVLKAKGDAGGWIAVGDRMPETEDWKVVYDGNYVGMAFHIEEGWSMADDLMFPDEAPVTHWKELPSPPQDGAKG